VPGAARRCIVGCSTPTRGGRTLIQFTKNYSDRSNPQGFQFEFFCDKCRNGYKAAAAQAQAGVEQVREKARATSQVEDVDMAAHRVAACPHCSAHVEGGKFCPECGKPLSTRATCKKCGSQFDGKFCSECGTPRPSS